MSFRPDGGKSRLALRGACTAPPSSATVSKLATMAYSFIRGSAVGSLRASVECTATDAH